MTVLVNVFIVLFLLFMWGWDYPEDFPIRKLVGRMGRPLAYWGLWHGWAMFAPEPIYICRWLKAVVRFRDGTVEVWEPLGPQQAQRTLNTLHVRSFKFQHSVLCGRHSQLYKPLCDFLARQAVRDLDHKVVASIELFREFRYVRAPGADSLYSPIQSVSFFKYSAS